MLSTEQQPKSRRITNYGRRRRRRVEPRVHGPLDRIFSPTHPLPHRMEGGLPVPPGPFLTFPWLGGTEGRCLAYMEPQYLPLGLYTFLGSVRPFEAFLTSQGPTYSLFRPLLTFVGLGRVVSSLYYIKVSDFSQ